MALSRDQQFQEALGAPRGPLDLAPVDPYRKRKKTFEEIIEGIDFVGLNEGITSPEEYLPQINAEITQNLPGETIQAVSSQPTEAGTDITTTQPTYPFASREVTTALPALAGTTKISTIGDEDRRDEGAYGATEPSFVTSPSYPQAGNLGSKGFADFAETPGAITGDTVRGDDQISGVTGGYIPTYDQDIFDPGYGITTGDFFPGQPGDFTKGSQHDILSRLNVPSALPVTSRPGTDAALNIIYTSIDIATAMLKGGDFQDTLVSKVKSYAEGITSTTPDRVKSDLEELLKIGKDKNISLPILQRSANLFLQTVGGLGKIYNKGKIAQGLISELNDNFVDTYNYVKDLGAGIAALGDLENTRNAFLNDLIFGTKNPEKNSIDQEMLHGSNRFIVDEQGNLVTTPPLISGLISFVPVLSKVHTAKKLAGYAMKGRDLVFGEDPTKISPLQKLYQFSDAVGGGVEVVDNSVISNQPNVAIYSNSGRVVDGVAQGNQYLNAMFVIPGYGQEQVNINLNDLEKSMERHGEFDLNKMTDLDLRDSLVGLGADTIISGMSQEDRPAFVKAAFETINGILERKEVKNIGELRASIAENVRYQIIDQNKTLNKMANLYGEPEVRSIDQMQDALSTVEKKDKFSSVANPQHRGAWRSLVRESPDEFFSTPDSAGNLVLPEPPKKFEFKTDLPPAPVLKPPQIRQPAPQIKQPVSQLIDESGPATSVDTGTFGEGAFGGADTEDWGYGWARGGLVR